MVNVLKLLGAPGSITFFVLAIFAGLALIRFWRRFRRIGAVWLIVVTATYVVLALPIVANAIGDALPTMDAPPADGKITTLIVLDGDNRRGRVREVQRVLRKHAPATIWVLGGRWILDALKEAGVSGPAFRYDARAETTRDQIAQVQDIVRATPGSTVVIASRLQASRVAALVRGRGIPVTVLQSAVDTEPPTTGLKLWLPAYIALRVSRDAIYEHGALAYYRVRGSID